MSDNFEDILCGKTKVQEEFLSYLKLYNNGEEEQNVLFPKLRNHLETMLSTSELNIEQQEKIVSLFDNAVNNIHNKEYRKNILTYNELSLVFSNNLNKEQYIDFLNVPIGIVDKKIEIFSVNVARAIIKNIFAGYIAHLKGGRSGGVYYISLSRLNYEGIPLFKPQYVSPLNYIHINRVNF